MGFISGALDKSVFTKESYKSAIGDTSKIDGVNGYAAIRIAPDANRSNGQRDLPVIGIIQKSGLNFSIDATWESLGDIGGSVLPQGAQFVKAVYEKINNFSMIAGNADVGSVVASRKIYRKSGYLIITPNMRIVDWKGIGQPIMSSLLLATYATPHPDPLVTSEALLAEIKSTVNGMLETMKAKKNEPGATMTQRVAGVIIEWTEGVLTVAGEAIDNVDNITTGGFFGKTIESAKTNLADIDKDLSLRSSPVPVTLSIGTFFKRKDMVIESIKFDFSKEVTASGPLYVDIDLTLSSRKIITSENDLGFLIPNGVSRVGYVNSTGF
jgi:hypothetical protein